MAKPLSAEDTPGEFAEPEEGGGPVDEIDSIDRTANAKTEDPGVVQKTEHPSLHAAMIAAFSEIKPIDRGAEGQIQNRTYAYATLADILAHVQPILAGHGLAVYQPPIQRRDESTGTLFVGCGIEILHTSGEYRSSEFLIACPNETPQAMGSVITYARRYSYPFFIQADEDDDDGAAGQPSNNGGRANSAPPGGDLPRTGTTRRSGPPASRSASAASQSGSKDETDPHIERAQAVTLTGLASRRATEFEGVSGADILADIAKQKKRGTWDSVWPLLRMSQVNAVSKVIQEWEPPDGSS